MPIAQSENRLVILWVRSGIVATPLFKIDVHRLVSVSVWYEFPAEIE